MTATTTTPAAAPTTAKGKLSASPPPGQSPTSLVRASDSVLVTERTLNGPPALVFKA